MTEHPRLRAAATGAALLLLLAGADGRAEDTAPPPRFGSMQTQDLAPLPAPAVPEPAAPAQVPAPAQPATAAAPPTANATRGLWLQLGAFREPEGARDLQARTTRSLPALAPRLRVFSEAGTHRLQAGPYVSREAANDMALQLRSGLGLVPIVIERP